MAIYDILIVGAGAAGCVLAARLSEDPTRSVLLLEAGPDYPDPSTLPPEIAKSAGPAYTHDWGYDSEPSVGGRAGHLPRGKLVGGSSATNAAMALRGATPFDYDEWAALGNPDWSFSQVLPYFRRLERDAEGGDAWHGRGGPVPIRRPHDQALTRLQRAFARSCVALDHRYVADHNAPGVVGVGPCPKNEVDGMRQSAALTYLHPARSRLNLTIRSGVLIDRVAFEGRRAVGVRLAGGGEIVRADRVILAAGAYGSPAILLRSGVGPGERLRALGIDVRADVPGVGQHLTDHPLVGLAYASKVEAEGTPAIQTVLTFKSAPAVPGFDLQILPAGPWSEATGPTFRLLVSLLKPRSHGEVGLNNADPSVAPRIAPAYCTHPDDLPRLLEAVRAGRRLAKTPPLTELLGDELFPGPGVPDSGAALEAAVRYAAETYHHPVGTCHMGPATDASAVVDGHGQVHGVDRLWVIDASIMPSIPAANTHLPTLMVAERCVAWLRED